MSTDSIETRYGVIALGGVDVSGIPCQSIDLRGEINPAIADETVVVPPGTFRRALFNVENEPPVGEIRTLIWGSEVRIVWEATGRPGIIELAMDKVRGVLGDATYAEQWRAYLGGLQGGAVIPCARASRGGSRHD